MRRLGISDGRHLDHRIHRMLKRLKLIDPRKSRAPQYHKSVDALRGAEPLTLTLTVTITGDGTEALWEDYEGQQHAFFDGIEPLARAKAVCAYLEYLSKEADAED